MKLTFPKYDAALVEEIEAFLDQSYQTEITRTEEHLGLGITYTRARGFSSTGRPGTRGMDSYARPMFQLIQDRAFSGSGPRGTLCQCGDFAYSWNCPEHDELPWDSEARRWIRPAAYWTPEPPPGGPFADYIRRAYEGLGSTTGLRPSGLGGNPQHEINTDGLVFRDAFDVEASRRLLDSLQAGAAEYRRRLASLPPAAISITFDVEQEPYDPAANRVVHIQIETEGGGPRGR